VLGLGQERRVETDEVRFPEKGRRVGSRGPEFPLRGRVGRDGVLVENAHVEAERPPGYSAADAAEADDAECLAMDVAPKEDHVLPLSELALADVAIRLDDAAGGGHEERPGEVSRGLGEDVGSIRDDDPARGRRRHVDVVEADGHVGHHLEIGARGQQRRVDGVGDEADEALAAFESRDELGRPQGLVSLMQIHHRATSGSGNRLLGQEAGNQNGNTLGW
jgi:hypothetical protein